MMDFSRLALFSLIILFYFNSAETARAGEPELRKQFNKFKRHVNYNFLEISSDITTLFESVDNLTLVIERHGTKSKAVADESELTPVNSKLNKQELLKILNEVREDFEKKNALLYKAFVSEKLVNRELRSQLDTLKLTVDGIIKNQESASGPTGLTSTGTTNVTTTAQTTKVTSTPPVSCETVPRSGVYDIHIGTPESRVTVFCDKDADDEGWIVFLRRKDGSENFNRNWLDYKNGFGDLKGEFWAGNDLLYKLTESKPMTLRIEMEDFDGDRVYAQYEQFQIGPEVEQYRLTVSGYSGTAGDSLINAKTRGHEHNYAEFTTFDRDNDKYRTNCAKDYKGGWWFNACFQSLLTGPYSKSKDIEYFKGVIWYTWTGWTSSLKFVEMKLR